MLAKKPNRIGEVGEEKEGACESGLMESSPRDHKRESTLRLRCVNSADPSPGHLSQVSSRNIAPQTTSASVLGFQLGHPSLFLTQHTHDSHLHPHNETEAEKNRRLPLS